MGRRLPKILNFEVYNIYPYPSGFPSPDGFPHPCGNTEIVSENFPNTGGCLEAGQSEESYLVSWISEFGDQIFELPTGGVCNMGKGKNLISFAKKEQCLALVSELRRDCGISNYKIFRLFPNNEIEYLHPSDGV